MIYGLTQAYIQAVRKQFVSGKASYVTCNNLLKKQYQNNVNNIKIKLELQ